MLHTEMYAIAHYYGLVKHSYLDVEREIKAGVSVTEGV
jgi:hypothetical protein